MNEVEMLALGDTLARTSEVLRPDEHVSFRDKNFHCAAF